MNLAVSSGVDPDAGGRTGNARRALWTMVRQACNAAALTHGVFLLVFARLGLPLLVGINLASIALFVGARALLSRRRNIAAVSLIGGEVVFHAAVASALLGWDSGFHYYLLILVGPLAVGMNGTTAGKLARLLAFGASYVALDAWTRQMPPVYRLEPVLLAAIRYANIAGMLVIMAFISLTYYRLVASAERALRALATTDPLTGLYNRRQLLDIVRTTRAAGPGAPGLFVLLCDLDHFKQVNDDHGHQVGDLVLERVAGALRGAVRTTDSVARWGGEEFVVLLPGVDLASAMQTGERIRGAVAAMSLQVPAPRPRSPTQAASAASVVPVSITIGVARVGPSDTIEAAISRADAALYRGKAAGRNRVVVDIDAAATSGS